MANNAVVNILVVLDQLLHASKVTVISSREQYKYLHMYHVIRNVATCDKWTIFQFTIYDGSLREENLFWVAKKGEKCL